MSDWVDVYPRPGVQRDIVDLCREQAELHFQREVMQAKGRPVPPIETLIYWQAADEIERLRGTLPMETTGDRDMEWQPIDGAPRNGKPFLARQGEIVHSVFYKPNTNWQAKNPETLQVLRPGNQYCAANRWFRPTHWAPLDPINN